MFGRQELLPFEICFNYINAVIVKLWHFRFNNPAHILQLLLHIRGYKMPQNQKTIKKFKMLLPECCASAYVCVWLACSGLCVSLQKYVYFNRQNNLILDGIFVLYYSCREECISLSYFIYRVLPQKYTKICLL